ncbi:hypothetical protein AB0J38_30670 [Streptomyces sp. NPDC050095]|uniref:hypothetical protein n=1 Tax=unclassified Streptomyces TaxID=2593676 RepID=UPI00342FE731
MPDYPDYYVKDAQAAQKAVTALDTHYGFMKAAGGAAESIKANFEMHYSTDGGSAHTFRSNFTTWQEGYQKAMTAVDTVLQQLTDQQRFLDAGEQEALGHAQTGFDTSSIENILNGNGGGAGTTG